LREHIVEVAKANVVRERRALVAQKLLRYITSPQFRNPIEEVTRAAGDLQEMIVEEFKDHRRVWQKRLNYYRRIEWDSSQVDANIALVLQGKEPKAIVHPKSAPLQLPAASERALAAKAGE